MVSCSFSYLDWKTPQAEHTAEQVAAPQQLAPKVKSVLALGKASSGKDRRAPIMETLSSVGIVEATMIE